MVKISKIREIIVEALSVYGAKGADKDEVYALIYDDLYGDNEVSKRKSLSNALFRAIEADCAVRAGNRYYLKEYDPMSAVSRVNGHSNSNGTKAQIAPYAGKRTGKTVSIYKSPVVFTDAIALSFLIDEQWYKMPLFGSVRICIGPGDPPMWSADQEMYRGVVRIRITHKGGTATEEHTSPSDIITIAPED